MGIQLNKDIKPRAHIFLENMSDKSIFGLNGLINSAA
jgi:hypothetical protein